MSDKRDKNYYLAAVKDGKVVASFYAWSLAAIATVMVKYPDCEVEAYDVRGYGFAFGDAPVIKAEGMPVIRAVRCLETGEVWQSVKQCSLDVGLPLKTLYTGIRRRNKVYGHTYEYYAPAKDNKETDNEEQNG